MDLGNIPRVWLPLVGASVALGAIYQSPSIPHGPLRLIGVAVAVAGLFGVIIARYTLGKSFSVRARATALVTRGIYSRIRNPIYVSGILLFFGVFLMLGHPQMLLIFVILIPLQVVRARREAAVLEAEFGDEYREYRKRTWF
jgi:protein-S-isoprenylcysteine O-methyltransferase Ste14